MTLKVLCIIPDMRTGGAERQMALILNHLSKEVFSLKLCVFNKIGDLLNAIPADTEICDLEKRSRWSIGNLALKLSRLIRLEKPDVLYSRMQYANTITSLAIQLSGRRPKHVANEATTLSQHLSELRGARALKMWIRKVYSRIDHIVAPSEVSKQDLISEFRVLESKVSVIYNSVDSDSLRNFQVLDPLPRANHCLMPRLISVGSLRPVKGHKFLLRALKEVLLFYPNCQLEILGEGPERASLTEYAEELGIRSHVHMPGIRIPYSAVSQADIFVLPSLREGMPGSLLEAMALKVPVIASSVGGVPEVVENGENGVLVAPGNWQEMVDRIVELLDDQSKRQVFASNAFKSVTEKFDIKKNVKKLERVFLDLTAK
jgi:glycosyltransferase involved in cell wall biosynthesis